MSLDRPRWAFDTLSAGAKVNRCSGLQFRPEPHRGSAHAPLGFAVGHPPRLGKVLSAEPGTYFRQEVCPVVAP